MQIGQYGLNYDDKEDKSTSHDDTSEGEQSSDGRSYEENKMFSDIDYERSAFVQDVKCNINDKTRIPNSWILLDSQSTVDVLIDKKLLKKICDPKILLYFHCNTGMTTVNKIGEFIGYGTVWNSMEIWRRYSNKPFLNNVKKKYLVNYDCPTNYCFEVHKKDGACVYALEKGLLYSNVNSDKVFVTTVEYNTNIHTIRVYSSAEKASELQNIIGRPST